MKLHQLREMEVEIPANSVFELVDDLRNADATFSIDVRGRDIHSLYGCPKACDTLNASGNYLTDLKYCPSNVTRTFNINENEIVSLKGGPLTVINDYYCSQNFLTSLEFGPTHVGRYYDCEENFIETLDFAPTEVNEFFLSNNKLTSLKGIHKRIKKMARFYATNNPDLKHHMLGLILIDNLDFIEVDDKKLQLILNKYLEKPNKKLAMLQCQQELIEAGFEDAAQL